MKRFPFVILLALMVSFVGLVRSNIGGIMASETGARRATPGPPSAAKTSPVGHRAASSITRSAGAFHENNQPAQTITFRAVSRGAKAEEFAFQYGVARFYKNGVLFYQMNGGGGGGRGFNIAAFDSLTGNMLQPVRNFDTWGTRGSGAAMQAMVAFLNSFPDGTLFLIAVADDAGLNLDNSCDALNNGWNQTGIQTLKALKSEKIDAYCFRASWCLITVKGEGQARGEGLSPNTEVSAETTLTIATPCPAVGEISPASGGVGTNVTITGSRFSGVNAVKFANNNPANFTVDSDTQITAFVPFGAVTGPIMIGKPDCSTVQTGVFTVTVPCPAVSQITPSNGIANASVTILGSNFTGVNAVVFANNAPASFVINSASQITATVPFAAVSGRMTIRKPGCPDVQTDPFTINLVCPSVATINPTGGLAGSQVTITGSNLGGVRSVTFATNITAAFTINGPTQITATVPAGAVSGPVVIGAAGCPDVQTAAFTVTRTCQTANAISPRMGIVGTLVTITGNNLAGASAVKFFSGIAATFTINGDGQITATVPAGARSGPVTISKPGCGDVMTEAFTVQAISPDAGMLYGVDFSPYLDGQDPNQGAQVSKKQLKKRLRLLVPFTKWVRTFGTGNGQDLAGQLAHKFGLQIAMGAWLSRDLAANEREITTLIESAQAGKADLLVVGSEVLLRGDLTESQLIAYIERVKRAVPGLAVTTGEVYGVLLAHPDLIAAVDVVFVNIYPYWEGVAINNAINFLDSRYQQVKAAAGGKTVMISETGWPSCGNAVGGAVPSPQNAGLYFRQFVEWARAGGVAYFYFEAFNESWKARYEGPQGSCWGIWDQEGNLKPEMQIP